MFDSLEEAFLYSILIRISNISVFPHQHLRDLFETGNAARSKKLSYMHCDFVIRDCDHKVMFGIEIDGMQHQRDREQFANDRLKDDFFAMNNLILLRFKAEEIRQTIDEVIQNILSTATKLDSKSHILDGDLIVFQDWSSTRERNKQEVLRSKANRFRNLLKHMPFEGNADEDESV